MNTRKLKIGIACYPTYGGSGVLATELGIALADEGHEIHFLSYETPFRLTEFHSNIVYHQVGVQEYPLFKYPPYALALATTMAEVCDLHQLDIIHVHYAIPHLVSANLARQMLGKRDVKVIATLHGTDVTIIGHDPSYKRVMKFSLGQADGITAVSSFLKKETYRTVGTTCEIEVIPNFVDLKRFDVKPCPEASKLRKDGEQVLIHVSNFRPVKRINDIIEATAEILKKIPVRLLMVGDGPDRHAAEVRSRELGISDSISFLGSQDNIEKILPCADIFLLPSEFESFGLSALEAMACGVATVATNAGGIPEVVEDGVTGRLVPVGDIKALAQATIEILEDPEQLRSMGIAARARAKRLFRIENIIPQYTNYYWRILDEDGDSDVQDVVAT
jgi:N-acetyl-alpha-D-glucosaminyl L-malate synthase BshA